MLFDQGLFILRGSSEDRTGEKVLTELGRGTGELILNRQLLEGNSEIIGHQLQKLHDPPKCQGTTKTDRALGLVTAFSN